MKTVYEELNVLSNELTMIKVGENLDIQGINKNISPYKDLAAMKVTNFRDFIDVQIEKLNNLEIKGLEDFNRYLVKENSNLHYNKIKKIQKKMYFKCNK